jgi:predicted PurR-regulated permease PerM
MMPAVEAALILDLSPPMAGVTRASSSTSVAIWILVALATLWFLRAAQSLLIPIALAVLISYALEPPVAWLARHHVNRTIGSVAVLLVVLAAIGAGAYMLKDDLRQTAESLPKAADRARQLVASQLRSSDAVLGNVAGTSGSDTGDGGAPKASQTSNDAGGSLLERVASRTFAFAGHLVVVVFLVLFLLLSGHHVRSRLVEVMGSSGRHRSTAAAIIDDITEQIQRYLLVLLFTGALVGTVTWLVLAWIGVQNAMMWGLLAGVFNSIPYFGPVVVSGGLFVVGLVQGGGVSQALQMSAAAIVITSIEGWLVTPPLMGKVERMSALAVFLGLLLWTWIWGAWGTILAVPMLVIIKSIADHVERLRPVARLMAP